MSDHYEINELPAQKQARRRRLAKLSFEEKIEIIERLRELRFNREMMPTRQTKLEVMDDAQTRSNA
jgi:hypothetical protein